MKFVVIFTLIFIVQDVYGHGRLRTPPSRASMWRDGFDNPPDYSDNQGFCGGATVSTTLHGMKNQYFLTKTLISKLKRFKIA